MWLQVCAADPIIIGLAGQAPDGSAHYSDIL
jgi:hypothetical protein